MSGAKPQNHETYVAIHKRLKKERGFANEHKCVECKAQASDWACVAEKKLVDEKGRKFSTNLYEYVPMCRSCHWKLDEIGYNFHPHLRSD